MSSYLYFVLNGFEVKPNQALALFPFVVITMALYGLGFGMILTSMTTKYRDLSLLVTFGVQLLMYVSAVMYPLSEVQERIPQYGWLIEYNPLAIVIESFRFMALGEGTFSILTLAICLLVSLVLFLIGLVIFNRTEKNFIDTV